METSQFEPLSSKKFSRKEFLKLVGLVGAGIVLKPIIDATTDVWQPKIVELGLDVLENPAAMEIIIDSSANSLEELALRDRRAEGSPPIEKNPSYKSLTDIIGEVLDRRRNEGKPITYHRVTGYEKLPYYLDKVRSAAHDPYYRDRSLIESGEVSASSYILGYKPAIVERLLENSDFFPQSVRELYDVSNHILEGSINLAKSGGGFSDRMIEALGEESRILLEGDYSIHKNDQQKNYLRSHIDQLDQAMRAYLKDIIQHTESLVKQQGSPISSGEIFSYCLDRNMGSIDKSLRDTMVFLKYMCRCDTTLRTFYSIESDLEAKPNKEWFKQNVLDEYGKIGSYTQLPHDTYSYNGLLSTIPGFADTNIDKDLHLLNQIGKPYHSWNIAMLIIAIPPVMAQVGVALRQFKTFEEQGLVKTAADFRVALQLNKLDALFMQYS